MIEILSIIILVCFSVVLVYVFLISSIYLHEIGHLIAAILCKIEVIEGCFCVGKRKFRRGKYIFGFSVNKSSSYIFCNTNHLTKYKGILLSIGGPIMNLMIVATSLVILIAVYKFKLNEYINFILYLLIIINTVLFIRNLIPTGSNGIYSDGKNLYMRFFRKNTVTFFISKQKLTYDIYTNKLSETPLDNSSGVQGIFYATDTDLNNGYFQANNSGVWCVVSNRQCQPTAGMYSTFKEVFLNQKDEVCC